MAEDRGDEAARRAFWHTYRDALFSGGWTGGVASLDHRLARLSSPKITDAAIPIPKTFGTLNRVIPDGTGITPVGQARWIGFTTRGEGRLATRV